MKRSFFITLFLYVALFALILNLPTLQIREDRIKVISLENFKIAKNSNKSCNCIKKSEEIVKKEEVKKIEKKVEEKPKEKKVIEKKIEKKPIKKIIKKKKPKKIVKKRKKRVKKVAKTKKPPVKNIEKKAVKVKEEVVKDNTDVIKNKTDMSNMANSSKKTSHKPQKPSYSKVYMDSFYSDIYKAIKKNIVYPRIARKRRKEGCVTLFFTLTPNCEVKNLKVLQSSGYKLLDKAAMRCIKRAAKDFPQPKERVDIKVPIEYRLK